ncbi:MAG: hypothetical protein KBG15_14275 [Kofleriaceae bacterium]|nr:hypothetical protein [Kofleriaceae bacterium]
MKHLKLAHLAVNLFVKRLPDVPLLRQLEVLELFRLDAREADILIANGPALKHLKLLDLRGSSARPEQRKALAALGPRVVFK